MSFSLSEHLPERLLNETATLAVWDHVTHLHRVCAELEQCADPERLTTILTGVGLSTSQAEQIIRRIREPSTLTRERRPTA